MFLTPQFIIPSFLCYCFAFRTGEVFQFYSYCSQKNHMIYHNLRILIKLFPECSKTQKERSTLANIYLFTYLFIDIFVLQLYERCLFSCQISILSWHVRENSGTLESLSREQNVSFISLLTLCGGCGCQNGQEVLKIIDKTQY